MEGRLQQPFSWDAGYRAARRPPVRSVGRNPCGQGVFSVPVILQPARQSGRRKPFSRKVPPIAFLVLPTSWPV